MQEETKEELEEVTGRKNEKVGSTDQKMRTGKSAAAYRTRFRVSDKGVKKWTAVTGEDW